MTKTVDLVRLAAAVPDYQFAFLITVDDDHRAHTTAVTPVYRDGVFEVAALGRHGRANLAGRSDVTLVFPSRDVAEYSLIVDGDARVPADPDVPVRVTPKHALLHRVSTGEVPYDCVMLTETG